MLVEMIRENMTRETQWFTRMQAFQATKKYLEGKSKEELRKLLRDRFGDSLNLPDKLGRKKYQDITQGISSALIARFLSTDEQTVTRDENGNTY